jgi:hypothetical protein
MLDCTITVPGGGSGQGCLKENKMEKVTLKKYYSWTVSVEIEADHVDLDIFFKKNGVQVMYNQCCSSFMLQQWDEKKAWAICRTMLDKAVDPDPPRSYTEDAKKRKRVLQRMLRDASSGPSGPLFDLIRQAWDEWQQQQKRAQTEQLRQVVRHLSPDEVEVAVAEAQVADVHSR